MAEIMKEDVVIEVVDSEGMTSSDVTMETEKNGNGILPWIIGGGVAVTAGAVLAIKRAFKPKVKDKPKKGLKVVTYHADGSIELPEGTRLVLHQVVEEQPASQPEKQTEEVKG